MWARDVVHAHLVQHFGNEPPQSIWYDMRQQAVGLRLTESGFAMLTQDLGLQYWCYIMDPKTLHAKNLLSLDRYLACPYYLRRQQRQLQLVLLGDRESMMASLYGDVEKFIVSLKS